MQPVAKFKIGDRVVMRRNADWKNDIIGTVESAGRIRKNSFGEEYIDYFIKFDVEQADLTDEMHGDFDRRYWGSTCPEQYMELLPEP
jgi:hypothetical protein